MSAAPDENPELELADRFVTQTDRNIFLTGRAGTGKTTFLKSLPQITAKRFIVTAPTGVAAINAGGVTLHSFFQLPLGPYLPDNQGFDSGNRRHFKISKAKKEIINSLDLLVIDEISMVRADLLDAVDAVLRRIRRSHLPFGGVQLLMIGDLYQLPPVVKEDDWELLRQCYESAYFFSSRSLEKAGFIGIELKRVYRQSDDRFIRILNQIRYNRLDESSITELNRQYDDHFNPQQAEGYITLTTHNRKADTINQTRLQALPGKEQSFRAKIEGEFPEHITPAPKSLGLKKGAQVMFLRNDHSAEKRYYNGKVGKVKKVAPDVIEVICPGDLKPVSVEPVTWENIKYSLNQKTAEIEADIVGTFEQYPLKLAWAITIHKSQGLTFDKAIIDSQAAFSPGQTYVALSRCRTLSGIVLTSPIPARGIEIDPAVARFDTGIREQPPSIQQLEAAKMAFQQKLLRDSFDFSTIKNHLNQLIRLVTEHSGALVVSGDIDLREIMNEANRDIFVISRKFTNQLERLFQNGTIPESDPLINERVTKASVWFQDKINGILVTGLKTIVLETDNARLKQRITDIWDRIRKEIKVNLASVKSLENGFDPTHYLQQVSLAETDAKFPENKPQQPSSPDSNHPELANELLKWRDIQSETQGIAKHQILHRKTLTQIAGTLPVRRSDPPRAKPITITETKQTSYDLFKRGLTIDEIAKKRGLVKSTIEGHLCTFIELGLLDVDRLISAEKQEKIRNRLKLNKTNSLSAVKESLGDAFSYGEIKIVLAGENSRNK